MILSRPLLSCLAVAAVALPSLAQAETGIVLGQRAIARAEVSSFVKKQFAQMDLNRDGAVDNDEFAKFRARQPARPQGVKTLGHIGSRWMERTDANGDGRVTLAEAEERPLEMFDMADINRDGTVSVEEQSMAALFMR